MGAMATAYINCEAVMGAIGARSKGVYIVGMFFFKVNNGAEIADLLFLLTKSESSKVFAKYAIITPEEANLPEDVLAAIPYRGVENSATGDEPKHLWGYITSTFTNLVIAVGGFIYNGLVAVGGFIAHAGEVIEQMALVLIDYIQHPEKLREALAQAARVFNAAVEWVEGGISELFSGLKAKINELSSQLGGIYIDFINAVYNKDNGKTAIEFGKMMALFGAIAGLIYGIYWGLAIAINANPLVGTIITVLVTAAFGAVFYSLYPEEYRKAGEAIISAGELLLKPADELYEFDKQYCGSLGLFFSSIVATIGVSWTGVVSGSEVQAFIAWALSIATLFAMLPLLEVADYHDTTTKKVIAVGLLGIASYGLVSTTMAGWGSLSSSATVGGFLVRLLFFALFEVISAYSVLTLIGFLDEGV